MRLTRRTLLGMLGSAAVLPVLSRCGESGGEGDGLPVYAWDGPLGPEDAFADGVASGDPLEDAVILWTRVSPGGASSDPVAVFVEVAEDAAFARRVSAGFVETSAEVDHTVKVDATELTPGTTYFYRFSAVGRTSPVGRTRTAPAGPVDRLRFAVCACSNHAAGYFHAYAFIARRADLDAVIHLGDYIYEYETGGYGGLRPGDPEYEIVSLDDYRTRYRQYRSDPDLAEAHRQHPFLAIWDDHEFTNDPVPGGAENHQPETEGDWEVRKQVALRAYEEWMPCRIGAEGRIYRAFAFGDLARVVFVDTKRPALWPVEGDPNVILGGEQQAWAEGAIRGTTQPWLLIAQQVTFAPLARPDGSGGSWWDAWPEAREGLLDAAAEAPGAANVVVLTGDIHQARACDVPRDPYGAYDPDTGAGSEGVELVCSSISSPGGSSNLLDRPNHHWNNGFFRGYLLVDLTPDRMQADWFGFAEAFKVDPERPEEVWQTGFVAEAGTNHLVAAEGPAEPPSGGPALAP